MDNNFLKAIDSWQGFTALLSGLSNKEKGDAFAPPFEHSIQQKSEPGHHRQRTDLVAVRGVVRRVDLEARPRETDADRPVILVLSFREEDRGCHAVGRATHAISLVVCRIVAGERTDVLHRVRRIAPPSAADRSRTCRRRGTRSPTSPRRRSRPRGSGCDRSGPAG